MACHPSAINADRLASDLKSHNLIDLLIGAGVTLTEDESYFVERLEEFVVWSGRYPIPKSLEDFLPRTAPQGGWGPLTFYQSSDAGMIEALLERLSDDSPHAD